ncbi:s1 p1 nuclease, partial [Cystoisospora suis]
MLVAAIAREYVSEETAKKINFIFSQWAPQYPTTSTFETAAVWLDHLSCGASEIRKVKDLRSTPSHDSAIEKSTEGKIKEGMQTNPDEEEEGDQRGGGKYCRGFLFLDNIQVS